MQSFSPVMADTDTVFVPEKLMTNVRRFAATLRAEDLVGLAPAREKTEFIGNGKGIKKKGGNPPRDYTAVETLVDLRLHLQRNQISEALSAYFYLKRMVEGS